MTGGRGGGGCTGRGNGHVKALGCAREGPVMSGPPGSPLGASVRPTRCRRSRRSLPVLCARPFVCGGGGGAGLPRGCVPLWTSGAVSFVFGMGRPAGLVGGRIPRSPQTAAQIIWGPRRHTTGRSSEGELCSQTPVLHFAGATPPLHPQSRSCR